MLRILNWVTLLLGLLILGYYALIFADLARLSLTFGTGIFTSAVMQNPHLLAGSAVGLTLVVAAAYGFARRRRLS
jgi:hypothetical protein